MKQFNLENNLNQNDRNNQRKTYKIPLGCGTVYIDLSSCCMEYASQKDS